ncbi:uncharacterized protein LOC116296785, partial [Actinia tenebrosa]|uniref:Uncharacterized protein LOC116296785 n=1 Tax=Actinia tenebrosa TaxID=6105 RepID=A0A6P8HWF4_ACTTE
MIFQRIKDLFGLKEIPANVSGYQVDLRSVLIWCAREMRLHGCPSKDKLIFSLKLDGRPFYGRRQVLVALSPLQSPLLPVQSSKAIYPLAISNCEEDRNDLKELLQDLNHQKRALKKDGLHVDGKHWQVEFKVTLDLKALYVLLQKEDDDDFELGGRGLDVECCFLCPAVRGCPSDCKMKNSKCCPDHFEGSKANIGGFKGIREDLVLLLDEELTS